jgi:hypothetical protein
MAVQFHVLASGSSGNSCVLDVGGFGVLVDFGLSPKQLAPRMQRLRITWQRIDVRPLASGNAFAVRETQGAGVLPSRTFAVPGAEHAGDGCVGESGPDSPL